MSNYGYYDYQPNSEYGSYNPYGDTGNDGSNSGPTPPPKKPKKSSGFGGKLARAAALGLTFGLVAGVGFTGVTKVSDRLTDTAGQIKSEASDEKAGKGEELSLNSSNGRLDTTAVSTATTVTDVSDIVENVMPAIVQVSVMTVTEYQNWFGQVGRFESEGAGSGIIISQDDKYLYIATNNHVVSGAKELTITFNNDEAVEAEIQGTDPNTDLAVVRVKVKDVPEETLNEIKVATIGSSENLSVGSSAVVIGNALGYGQSVTTGVISALGRDVELQAEDGTVITNQLIQTDAAVNPGNSGGALLNMNGEVIGVVSAKYADTDVEGMGYAIPITEASEIITSLMNGEDVQNEATAGNGAYLGIAGVDVNAQTAAQYNMPTGVYVSQVITDSGAEAAGIQKGDVITGFNGQSIASMKEIQNALAQCSPGDQVTVTVARESIMGYAESQVQVTLTEIPTK